MADVIKFPDKNRPAEPYPTFTKVVDGETFECVDVDALSPRQRRAFFARSQPPLPTLVEDDEG